MKPLKGAQQALNFVSKAVGKLFRRRGVGSNLNLRGTFMVEHWRAGKLIGMHQFKNGITNEGKDHILDVGFHAASQITTWYVGLIDNSGFSALAAGDTMSSHAGWSESTAYDEATRVEWTEGAASSQSITNATALTFTMNATATIYGIFITSGSAKSGTSGTLWSTGAFSSPVAVASADELKVTYTINA